MNVSALRECDDYVVIKKNSFNGFLAMGRLCDKDVIKISD